MKNIFKYIFIFFGVLFLTNFFFTEKTYSIEACYCECGCNYIGGYVSSCKTCTCSNSCACGRSVYPGCYCYHCTCNCTCGCNYSSNGSVSSCKTTYPTSPTTTCPCGRDACTGNCVETYDISNCPGGQGDVCTGECSNVIIDTNCSQYVCDTGYNPVWDSSQESCICEKAPNVTDSPTCEFQCNQDLCCPAGTYCGITTSGNVICVSTIPPSPAPTTNTAPTSPTSLQTEGSTNPTTVSDTTPEFSAIFNDPDTSDSSNYYQIQVNTSSDFTGTVMWNTTKTSMASTSKGSRSPQISYAGTTLTLNGSTYYWRIKFWDVGGLESPWSSTANFKMCTNVDCDPSQYCESAGWSPTRLTNESILLEDVVKCTAMVNCQSVTKYGDCYEDPGIECTKDTDCDPGECCRGYTCTTDCSPAQPCTTDSECETDKCCVGNKECGKCITPDTQSLRVIMGNKISDTVTVSLWDRILAFFRKLNMLSY